MSPIPRGKKGIWTEEDNERLKAFVHQGVSIFRAATAFKRSIISVRNQARRVGTPFPDLRIARKKPVDSSSRV
jgi:hypothetical protein